MKLCDTCANCRGTNGTWYDPPECWCRFDRAEFDMDDEEVVEMMIEDGADPDDCEADCDQYVDADTCEPDPDFYYDLWRDAQMERD